MKKRNIIIVIVAIILSTVAELTNTTHILYISIFVIITVSYLLLVLTRIYLAISKIYYSNKYYRKLVKTTEKIKQYEDEKYKTYFMLSGKELEERIKLYDEYLDEGNDLIKSILDYLKDKKKYLSKNKYEHVLELVNNEIRETSRG